METVEIQKKWCKKCTICIEVCPQKVLRQNSEGEVVVENPEDCSMCEECTWICPDFAITIKSRK